MITKEITLCSRQVTLAYCYATEIAYKDLADEDMLDYAKHALESIQAQRDPDIKRTIFAIIACMMAYYEDADKAPVKDSDIMKEATDGYLDNKQQGFITSWIRHIPESTLPTYSGVLLMANISGLPMGKFIIGMIVPVIVLFLLGYFPYMRRVPADPGTPRSENRLRDLKNLFCHLWTLLVMIGLILVFKLHVVTAGLAVILAGLVVYRFKGTDILRMLRSAFEVKLLLNTTLVLVLKEFNGWTGILQALPEMMAGLPIPPYLIFALIFFLGGVISGASGVVAMAAPLAFAALPGSVPLMILFMCMAHGASLVSPTHVCLVVAADYFHVSMGELIRKTIPASLIFCLLMLGYYNLLILF
jgi:integral membrane protein (TIGR00529 family)